MGAQWIHGEGNNPVFDLAVRNDLVDQTKGINYYDWFALANTSLSVLPQDI